MNSTVIIILLILIMLGMFFLIPNYMTRRAVLKIIKSFRKHNAVGLSNAKTFQELGLIFPSFFQKMLMPRDYRPRALQILFKAGIVGYTEDGRLYLVEEKLAQTNLAKK